MLKISNQLYRLLFLFCFLPVISWSQTIVSGYVIDKNNRPLDSVMVFFQHSKELNTLTNTDGFFLIDYSDYEISGLKLTFYKEGYKEKIIPYKKLSNQMIVTLEPAEKKKENDLFEDDVVLLDEGIIYSSFAIDSLQKIYSVLDNVIARHHSNYFAQNTIYRLNGYHALSEKINTEREDTLLYIKNPLHIQLSAYNDPKIHQNSNIAVQPHSTLFIKNQKYTVPKNSPFFLDEQISWINFLNKDVLKKRKSYQYKILYEDTEKYEIAFQIKKIQKDSWSGVLTIRKDDFAVTRVETDLEFNRRNSYTIVSKYQSKNSTSIIYFEGAKIILDFAKKEDGSYHIQNLTSSYRIVHVGVSPVHTPQFLVQTQFEFFQDAFPEECRVLPLNELLYLAFHKNYRYEN